ncbi:hypothetical protein QLQ09_23415 [Brucella sp. NM4]|uniref:hypothetical protein n=1 Tax=Brucella/Ochrobactrum group TaxID=2826938 RepID=UPI0024BD4D20|nr:hypothetical protein [Brucella sp. NM4]WHS33208.1 hypothetical protein QLQ09_23415 [Brucella sp. NM4]WHT43309.1 hypothetical protein QLQ11_15470 [Ochrobactrum sp. SSR]
MNEDQRRERRGRPKNPIEKLSISIRLEAELVRRIQATDSNWRENIADLVRREFQLEDTK